MAKFLNKAGVVLETTDKDKIDCYIAQGLTELKEEPQPPQEVEATEDYVIRPAKKKKGTKKGV